MSEVELMRAKYNAYKRAYYKKNRRKEIARCTKWNKEHPEVVAANMRKYRANNPLHYKKQFRRWRTENQDRVRQYDSKKRAIRKGAIGSDKISASQWAEKLRAHQYTCFYCLSNKKKLTMDHVDPLSKGGRHHIDNVVPACADCNNRKNAKEYWAFIDEMKERDCHERIRAGQSVAMCS